MLQRAGPLSLEEVITVILAKLVPEKAGSGDPGFFKILWTPDLVRGDDVSWADTVIFGQSLSMVSYSGLLVGQASRLSVGTGRMPVPPKKTLVLGVRA